MSKETFVISRVDPLLTSDQNGGLVPKVDRNGNPMFRFSLVSPSSGRSEVVFSNDQDLVPGQYAVVNFKKNDQGKYFTQVFGLDMYCDTPGIEVKFGHG